MDKILEHLTLNIGVADFMREMYDNNKNLLYNESDMIAKAKMIREIVNNLPQCDFNRSKILDLLRAMVFFNDKALKTNQIAILKLLQDD